MKKSRPFHSSRGRAIKILLSLTNGLSYRNLSSSTTKTTPETEPDTPQTNTQQ